MQMTDEVVIDAFADAGVVVTGGYVTTRSPPPPLKKHSVLTNEYAPMADVNPFHCDVPRVVVEANKTHVVVTIIFYNEYAGDGISKAPINRTTFGFATYSRAAAYQPIPWDPSAPSGLLDPLVSEAFNFSQGGIGSYLAQDATLFTGMCDAGATSAPPYSSERLSSWPPSLPGYPRVSNLTQALTHSVMTGMTSVDLVGLTPQMAGCNCTSAIFDVASGRYHLFPVSPCVPLSAIADTGSTKVYASSSTSDTWSIRQTTEATTQCSIRTEALTIYSLKEFMTLPWVVVTQQSGVRSLRLSLYSVEIGSTAPWNGKPVKDTFTKRVNEHTYLMEISVGGAVVVPIDGGAMLPPMIIRTMGNTLDRVSADTVEVVWRLSGYVKQPATSVGGASIVFDPEFMQTAAVQMFSPASFQVTCQPFTADINSSSTYSCSQPSCGTTPQAKLPTYVLRGFNPASLSQPFMWLVYDMRVRCRITDTTGPALLDEWSVPASEVRVHYGLRDTTQNQMVTDIFEPPFVTFTTSFTVAGVDASTVALDMVGSVFEIEETSTAADTLSDIVYSNEHNSVASLHRFAYSQALAFRVQIARPADRLMWEVRPQLIVLAVHGQPLQNKSPSTDMLSSGVVLDTSFCGLDRTDLMGAYVFVDSGGEGSMTFATVSGGVPAELSQVGTLQVADIMTTSLRRMLAALVTNNNMTNSSLFRGGLGPSHNDEGFFAVPDSEGGFAVPLRNRLSVKGVVGGVSVTFCALVSAQSHERFYRNGWFPLYRTLQAAERDSGALANGLIPAPLVYYGPSFASAPGPSSTKPSEALKYYMPQAPLSTSGVTCVDRAAGLPVPPSSMNYTTPICTRFIPGGTRRRSLHTVQYDMSSVRPTSKYGATVPAVVFETQQQSSTFEAVKANERTQKYGVMVGVTVGVVCGALVCGCVACFVGAHRRRAPHKIGAGTVVVEDSRREQLPRYKPPSKFGSYVHNKMKL